MLEIETMIHEAYIKEQASKDPWSDSPYKELLKLTIDQRGKIGECIISEAIKQAQNTRICIEEDISDVSAKGDGVHYDIRVNGQMIEIKTAYRGTGNSWQHENLYKTAATMSIFLDFDYHGIYVSIFPEHILPLNKDSEVFGRKHGTLRKNKDDGYKLDFSLTTFKNFAKYDNIYSTYFDADNVSLKDIGVFITERILAYVDSI
jgi:hypothetical protein